MDIRLQNMSHVEVTAATIEIPCGELRGELSRDGELRGEYEGVIMIA